MNPFLIALQFLTRIPVALRQEPDADAIGRSLFYYPLVGLVLGLLLATLNLLAGDAPAAVRAAVVLSAWVALTGALHLDGLADSADAWAAGAGDRDRTLAVLQDPHSGPVAVVTLVLVLLLKFAALHGLSPEHGWLLVSIPLLARGVIPLLFMTTPYVRAGGLGSALAANRSRRRNTVAVAMTVTAALLLAGTMGLWLLLALAGVFLLLRAAMMRTLGGTTGDTAGALVEISEMALLVTAILISH